MKEGLSFLAFFVLGLWAASILALFGVLAANRGGSDAH